jgi:hypothetical protein
MQLSPQDAAAALAEVDHARSAMRDAIRALRGHYHLWIWGGAWVVMPLLAHFGGDGAARHFPKVCAAAGALSGIVGFLQGRQVRMPVNFRFVGVLAALLLFAAIFPFVLRMPADARVLYAYGCLVTMQAYVVAGLWTDSYLLWLGLAITALILVGFFLFPAIFWLWMAVFSGGARVAPGVYVRHFRR